MHTPQQEILLEADFADSTLTFKGLELNSKVFCTFFTDIFDWFNNVFCPFSSSIVYKFTAS